MEKLSEKKLRQLIDEVEGLLQDAEALEKEYSPQVSKVHPAFQEGGRNLLHYLAFRNHDNRKLQMQLSSLGLSSLGRAESHVKASLLAVKNQLQLLKAHLTQTSPELAPFPSVKTHLKENISGLLGEASPHREGRIMITFSADIADDYEMVRDLLKGGMNCARINCAHDDAAVWEKMVQQIRKAEKEVGRRCIILFDLMGPKLRTGVLKPGPKVVPIHPKIDEIGEMVSPAKVWLAPKGTPAPEPVDAALPVSVEWLVHAKPGASITFKDTRRRKRTFTVVQVKDGGALVHLRQSAYLSTGTELKWQNPAGEVSTETLGDLPPMIRPLNLQTGQELLLHRKNIPGEPARFDPEGKEVEPAHISCTLPEVFQRVKKGEPILFDDGEIEGVIEEVTPDYLRVKITAADENGSKLRPDKGINLPESDLKLHQLTEKDQEDLAFVVKHADVVNLSFVSHPEMVEELQQVLEEHQAGHIGIMLKIETKAAFRHLPLLLLTLMRKHPAGIMIARGDLAVELGWKRLAEVQEEILWIAEAAHLPVVWATQVLEKLTKKGRPSRAEITDAAMAQRADCVMLNKGPYILKSLEVLDDIMKRMQEHQYKKTALLRMLQVSELEGQPKV
ncbi:pyruvate kinase [Rufibacter latericius]|uniref:pyruvate kinase n=1 Tax=Rufibacter latericius TaxID=2487040 RepID=A0A3M9MY56_9BACT|nr:pyruvate kinase [Rufibacter latericius]RNI30459.1 pyruvate kinase [Rufibacter latericius]